MPRIFSWGIILTSYFPPPYRIFPSSKGLSIDSTTNQSNKLKPTSIRYLPNRTITLPKKIGVPEKPITLDHLGVLLAIRWREKTVPEYGRDIRTNINLFRHIFAYLSESQEILTTQVPDDGFLTMGKGKEGMVMNAVHEGKILKRMIESGPLK